MRKPERSENEDKGWAGIKARDPMGVPNRGQRLRAQSRIEDLGIKVGLDGGTHRGLEVGKVQGWQYRDYQDGEEGAMCFPFFCFLFSCKMDFSVRPAI